jgi:hypothetical protein
LLVALLLYTEESIPYSSVLVRVFGAEKHEIMGSPGKKRGFFCWGVSAGNESPVWSLAQMHLARDSFARETSPAFGQGRGEAPSWGRRSDHAPLTSLRTGQSENRNQF